VYRFDVAIISFFNAFAHRSFAFDSAVGLLSNSNLLKGVVIIALLWWVWFRPDRDNTRNRQILLTTLLAGALAVGGGKRTSFDTSVPTETVAGTRPSLRRSIYNAAHRYGRLEFISK